MKTWQKIGLGLLILAFPLAFGLYSLGIFKVLAPLEQNIKRDVWEGTKSYTHAVQADLGKYLEEYNKAGPDDKETLRQVIKGRFPSIPADRIQNEVLRNFLVNMRGY
jgi:hypothetical protein